MLHIQPCQAAIMVAPVLLLNTIKAAQPQQQPYTLCFGICAVLVCTVCRDFDEQECQQQMVNK